MQCGDVCCVVIPTEALEKSDAKHCIDINTNSIVIYFAAIGQLIPAIGRLQHRLRRLAEPKSEQIVRQFIANDELDAIESL